MRRQPTTTAPEGKRRSTVAAACLVPVVGRACYKTRNVRLALISRITKYMTVRRAVKKTAPRPRARGAIVVVVASPADLRRGAAITPPPDLFELRLDHLVPVIA